MRERARRLDADLERLVELWGGEFQPVPVQQPRIPVWVAARWPNRRPVRRAARWDGMFPIDLPGPEALAELVAEVRRSATTPSTVVVAEPAGTDFGQWEAAGATWCLTGFGSDPREAEVREAIAAGRDHGLDDRLRVAVAGRAGGGAVGGGRRARARRPLPPAVAAAGDVEDQARAQARRARDLLRAPARARDAVEIRGLFRAGHLEEARAAYREHAVAHAGESLDALAAELPRVRTALLCLEANPAGCHRRVVAELLAERVPGLVVEDL